MSDNAKQLLALFRKYGTDTLSFTDYFVIDDYEKAISTLENLDFRILN